MEFKEQAFRSILEFMRDREGRITSTARIQHEINEDRLPEGTDVHEGIMQLLILGELTLVWAQQAGRVIISESVEARESSQVVLGEGDTVWRCYIAEDEEERYHSGLFSSRQAAETYLGQVVGESEFERVPVVNCVYSKQISGFEGYGTHTAVIRCEPVQRELHLKE